MIKEMIYTFPKASLTAGVLSPGGRALDPGLDLGDPGVDSGVVGEGAAIAVADNAYLGVPKISAGYSIFFI